MTTDTIDRTLEYQRARDLGWDPVSITREQKLLETTKYDLPKHGYDPFRLTALEYFPMEIQNYDNLYGFLEGAVRHGFTGKVEPRFAELAKLVAAVLPPAEYAAGRIFGRAIRAIDVPELQFGYSFQVLDELRHLQMQLQCFNRFYVKHGYPDPIGFDRWSPMFSRNLACNIFRAGVESFYTNDPVTNLVLLQVFFETAGTNQLFIGVPDIAAHNGDDVYASCALSVQSHEARHMANGYATIMSMLEASDRNAGLLQDDMTMGAWRELTLLDIPIAYVYEYSAKRRAGRSALDVWDQYVHQQFYGSYMAKLEKWGIKIPDQMLADIQEWMRWAPHTLAIFAQLVWPLLFWRQEPLDAADFEYFEKHYPGYHERYGLFWQIIDETSRRGEGTLGVQAALGVVGKDLQLCQVCHLPTILPHPLEADRFRRFVKKGDRTFAFCSPWCEWIYDQSPGSFPTAGYVRHYDGWSLGDIVRDQGLLRPDGKTLVGQPRLDTLGTDAMWTIDDIDDVGFTLGQALD